MALMTTPSTQTTTDVDRPRHITTAPIGSSRGAGPTRRRQAARARQRLPKDALSTLLADPDAWILFDLRKVDDVAITAGEVAVAVATGPRPAGRTCVVASTRGLGRTVAGTIAVFTSSADACQAKLFFDA